MESDEETRAERVYTAGGQAAVWKWSGRRPQRKAASEVQWKTGASDWMRQWESVEARGAWNSEWVLLVIQSSWCVVQRDTTGQSEVNTSDCETLRAPKQCLITAERSAITEPAKDVHSSDSSCLCFNSKSSTCSPAPRQHLISTCRSKRSTWGCLKL